MGSVILVVEDQLAMQRSIQMGLTMSGYEVVTASDGLEALTLLDQLPVALILADVAMPRMNGYQLYEELRRQPRWALIPFIFISARALDSDIRYGKALGADDYLTKPFQLADLLAIVAGRLRRAAEMAQALAVSQPAVSQPAGAKPAAASPAPGQAEAAPAAADAGNVTAGSLCISHDQHRVWANGKLVELSPREFIFLEYLARRPGQAIPLTELCRATHGLETNAVEAGALLYPLVRSVRRRLGLPAGEMGCIESVRGIGYRLAA